MGGVISGYCVTGSVNSAIPPASVITMESTEAKIGRSIKKRENMEFETYYLASRGDQFSSNRCPPPEFWGLISDFGIGFTLATQYQLETRS